MLSSLELRVFLGSNPYRGERLTTATARSEMDNLSFGIFGSLKPNLSPIAPINATGPSSTPISSIQKDLSVASTLTLTLNLASAFGSYWIAKV
jgi:hypothetical protein